MVANRSRSRDVRGDLAGLFRNYSGWLRRVLAEKFGDGRADELTQEAFLRLARRGAQPVSHPKAYLMAAATSAARDQMRRSMVRGGGRTVRLADLPLEDEPRHAAGQDQMILLKQIVLGMPELYRDAFVLSRFGGLSYEEIAGRLGVSVKTVEWRMSKALAYCAARLGE